MVCVGLNHFGAIKSRYRVRERGLRAHAWAPASVSGCVDKVLGVGAAAYHSKKRCQIVRFFVSN